MIPNVVEGSNMTGLVLYLAGPGKANDHSNQHVVAGSEYVEFEFAGSALTRDDALNLARHIDGPRRGFGVDVTRKVRQFDPETGAVSYKSMDANTFHVSLSLSPEEGELSDEKWAAIAHDYVDKMGFGPGPDGPGSRWAAVRHGLSKKSGNDHIHIAISVVREDGSKVNTAWSFKRSQRVAGQIERDHGLRVLESRNMQVSTRGVTPAEQVRAAAAGQELTGRERLEQLVRAVSVSAANEPAFVDGLRSVGVLVRPRYATGSTKEVVGYSVAERPLNGESPVWYGGGSLARDLTLPRLRGEWGSSLPAVSEAAWSSVRPAAATAALTARPMPEPSWAKASADLSAAAARLRSTPVTDYAAWTGAAHQVAGVYAAWSRRVEGGRGPLRDLSRQLSRASGTTPSRVAHTDRRRAGRLLSAQTGMLMMVATGQASGQVAEVIVARQLTQLARAVIEWKKAAGMLHQAQQTERALEASLAAVSARLPDVPPGVTLAAPAQGRGPVSGDLAKVIEESERRTRERGVAPSPGPQTPPGASPGAGTGRPGPSGPQRGR